MNEKYEQVMEKEIEREKMRKGWKEKKTERQNKSIKKIQKSPPR